MKTEVKVVYKNIVYMYWKNYFYVNNLSMKNIYSNVILTLIFLIIGFILVLSIYNQEIKQDQFEFKIVGYADSKLTSELNLDGKDGWQIVGSRRAVDDNKQSMYELILQRKIIREK